MTITYDHEGKCTRCGSTGYYLDAELLDEDWDPHHHYSVQPCPCHGWRPIEWAPEYLTILVGAQTPRTSGEAGWRTARAWRVADAGFWAADAPGITRPPFAPTHWQYSPKAPEGTCAAKNCDTCRHPGIVGCQPCELCFSRNDPFSKWEPKP